MRKAFEQVTEFHRLYEQPIESDPTTLSTDRFRLRMSLMHEELAEYEVAAKEGNIEKVADALADLCYVVIGTAVEHGLTRFGEIFDEVHRSNLSKLGADGKPVKRADGKTLKGPNYQPPRLRPILFPNVVGPVGSSIVPGPPSGPTGPMSLTKSCPHGYDTNLLARPNYKVDCPICREEGYENIRTLHPNL